MRIEEVSALLRHILGHARFPGGSELWAQSMQLTQVSGPPTMIEIEVASDVPLAQIVDGPIPPKPGVVDAAGVEIGEILTWVTNGRLSALEFAWWSDSPPTALPDVSQLRLTGG